jgi:hypothetical protein
LGDDEVTSIEQLNSQYLRNGQFHLPSRYRPTAMRVITSVSQSTVEGVVATIIRGTSRPDLLERILSR